MQPLGDTTLPAEVRSARPSQSIISEVIVLEHKHFPSGDFHHRQRNFRQFHLQQHRMDSGRRGEWAFGDRMRAVERQNGRDVNLGGDLRHHEGPA